MSGGFLEIVGIFGPKSGIFKLAIREGYVQIPFITLKTLLGAWYLLILLCRRGVFMLEKLHI